MIKTISSSVRFPISGKSFRGTFSPQPGITAVTGRNGSFKTFRAIESIRYLLYGSEALRGVASDYEDMEQIGTVVINGKDVTIERTPKGHRLFDENGVIQATGARAVTAKVIELMGYGLTVFDVCNASTQKNTDIFSKLGAPARKRLIDEVVGLTSNEAVEKACRKEATIFKAGAEALQSQLRAPVQPEAPENYRYFGSKKLEEQLAEARRVQSAHAKLILLPPAALPVEPSQPQPAAGVIRELELHEQNRILNERERERLTQQATCPRPSYDADQLVAARNRLRATEDWERRGVKPRIPLDDIEAMEARWNHINALFAIGDTEVECPTCQTVFAPGADAHLEPEIPLVKLKAERAAHARWEGADLELPDGLDLSRGEIEAAEADLRRFEQALSAKKALEAIPVLEDLGPTLEGLKSAWTAWEVFEREWDKAEQVKIHNDNVLAERQKLPPPPTEETISELQQQHMQAVLYEDRLARYEQDVVEFDRLSAEITEQARKAEAYREGSKALASARAELKANLAPRFGRVASSLVYDMSAGAMETIYVDDDMEITIDGQRIETFSGAQETVINLALRVALGQILVGDTFPVFLGDEIDTYADLSMRAATTQAIKSLSSHLKQIILVTHRDVSIADHVLDTNL